MRRRWLRQTFQASVRAALEHGVLWWGSAARLRRLIRIDNPEAALGDGVRPVIWLAPHFVGLDMGGVRLTMDRRVASMYAPARNPVTDRMMRHGRSRFFRPVLISKARRHQAGAESDQGRTCPSITCRTRIRAGTMPCSCLSSACPPPPFRRCRAWPNSPTPRSFRSSPASCPGGAAIAVRFYPPWDNYPSDDLEADVARMNAFIEDRIREMPAQYLWLHRRFKTRPAGEPSLYE